MSVLFKKDQIGTGSGIFYIPPKAKSNGWWYEDRYYYPSYAHDKRYANGKSIKEWIYADYMFVKHCLSIVLKSIKRALCLIW